MFCRMTDSAIAPGAFAGLSSKSLCFSPAPKVCCAPSVRFMLPERVSASWIIGALLAQHGRQQSLRLPFHQASTRLSGDGLGDCSASLGSLGSAADPSVSAWPSHELIMPHELHFRARMQGCVLLTSGASSREGSNLPFHLLRERRSPSFTSVAAGDAPSDTCHPKLFQDCSYPKGSIVAVRLVCIRTSSSVDLARTHLQHVKLMTPLMSTRMTKHQNRWEYSNELQQLVDLFLMYRERIRAEHIF